MKAIHDREYATPPASFAEYRWRIQYLAELGVGRLLRGMQSDEEAAVQAVNKALSE